MAETSTEKGNLSINSENLFPIIKKWLYSDQDIFIRELISNGSDAITKLRKLEVMGEYQFEDDEKMRIDVICNADDKTLKFVDNGIGMTAEEVKKYITEIAFSGAADFLSKYKDKASDDQIIGHFGLGFYSAFMVADTVEIDSLSYREGAEPVHWTCDGNSEYSMEKGSWDKRGTQITLHLNEDCLEYANEYRVDEVIKKYCAFMPEEIYLHKEGGDQEYETIEKDQLREDDVIAETIVDEEKTEEKEKEDGTKETVVVSPRKERYKINKRPKLMNETHPLWAKTPKDCTDEEYKEFYRKVFHDYKEPLFWIHLNMDYPFNLKGILYFPKIATEYDPAEGQIKLFNSQVFVADNIKEIIPEYLLLLKGVIDCPDMPLNVSRSALQNDGFAGKISDYITKKVADKLSGMFKTDRENYEKYWDDINPFIKYGVIKDGKFADRMKDYIIYKDINDKYISLQEYLDAAKDKHENKVFYVTDENVQAQYIKMFKDQGLDALILRNLIDQPFMQRIESEKEDVHFLRIDSEVADAFKAPTGEDQKKILEEDQEKLSEIFKKALESDKLEVKVESLKDKSAPAIITMSESIRRMQDMMKMYGMKMDQTPDMEGQTLILNANSSLVKHVLDHPDDENVDMFCQQIYDLAMLTHAPLTADAMTKFVARSNKIMLLLAGEPEEEEAAAETENVEEPVKAEEVEETAEAETVEASVEETEE